MRRPRPREFWCPVVSEAVIIRLTRPARLSEPSGYFVQCNQLDCQYVDANQPPCPLSPAMFSDEIKAAMTARGVRPESDGD